VTLAAGVIYFVYPPIYLDVKVCARACTIAHVTAEP